MVSDLNPHDMCEEDTNERLGKVSSALKKKDFTGCKRRLRQENIVDDTQALQGAKKSYWSKKGPVLP